MNLFLLQLPQAAAASGPSMLTNLLPFLLIIVVFYFFMIRPQMKRQKELRKFRESLKKGDKVVTTGGIYGTVAEIKDDAIVVEIADNVKVKIDKSAVIMDMTDAVKR
jgi:preprotein translocase subunit YajC